MQSGSRLCVKRRRSARQLDLDASRLATLLAVIKQTVTTRLVKGVPSIIRAWPEL